MEKHRFNIQRDRTHTFTVALPYDITGYSFGCEVETKAGANIAAYTVEPDTEAQTVTFTLSHTVTATISVGEYVYDVAELTASGDKATLFGGTVNVSNPVTEI